MNILVLNGSPKGDNSITLQTVLYIKKHFPAHTYTVLNAGSRIRSYEKDFTEAAAALREADLILFAYPVYTFLVPSQLHRFIELIKENGVDVRGRYATQITTSKHFYDVTAHRFIEDNCEDLGLRVIRGLSADMEDLLTEKGRKDAREFMSYVEYCVENGLMEPVRQTFTEAKRVPVNAAPAGEGTDDGSGDAPVALRDKPGDVVIVADLKPGDTQLEGMISRFMAVSPRKTRLVNIQAFPFGGGCISCFNCAADGTCIYKDGFDRFLRENIQTAEAIVLAFSIRDHSMGSRFKMYDDRQFCNGHRTVTMGKAFGYLVSGNLGEEENLRLVIRARAEAGGNFLAGIATDEKDTDGEIDALAKRLDYAVRKQYVQPANFYGVGGMKIFRDLIWQMQGLMKADHKFYKAHGQYDFPQKKRGRMLAMYLVGGMMQNEKIKKKMGGKMTEGMLMPYKKVLKKKICKDICVRRQNGDTV
ncbi:MAG: NAD(P)H-dependent oxidoreductase [Lachnospiraceae bacterium]|nr:NAD(P)H-dependent oxidoreductase [Lachnospiraceae bacterium]